MATLAAYITQAIIKVSTDETYASIQFVTREDARDNFVAALLFELGLGPKPVVEHTPVPEPKKEEPKKEEPVKEKKKPGPKPKKVAEPAPEPAPAAEAPAANAGAEPEPKKEEPVKEKKKPGPKPKAKPAEEEGVKKNLEKLTPTHMKHIKAIAEELGVEPKTKEFLAYANGLTPEAWKAKRADGKEKNVVDHIRDFLSPPPAPLAPAPAEFIVVEFKDVEYLVDPLTKFIYENVEEGATVRNHIGVVGQNEFKEMEFSTDNSTE